MRNKNYALLFLLFFGKSAIAQIDFSINTSEKQIIKGQAFNAWLEYYGLPRGCELFVDAIVDSLRIEPIRDGAPYSYTPQGEGVYWMSFAVKVKLNDTVLYEGNKTIEFVCYESSVVVELPLGELYQGIDNPVQILAPGVLPNDLTVMMMGSGSIYNMGKGSYKIVTSQACSTLTLSFSCKNPDGGIMSLGIRTFDVIPFPLPVFKPDKDLNALDNAMDLTMLAEIPQKLKYVIKTEIYYMHCTMHSNGVDWDVEIHGYSIQDKLLNAVKRMQKGDVLQIKELKYFYTVGNIRLDLSTHLEIVK